MNAIVRNPSLKPPKELARFFERPPLVGNETPADYDAFVAAIATAVKPTDAIDWLYVRDVVDLSRNICRERTILADIIKLAQKKKIVRGQTHHYVNGGVSRTGVSAPANSSSRCWSRMRRQTR